MALENEWAENTDSSGKVSAKLHSHAAAAYAWALALPSDANQKSTSSFTLFTYTLVVVGKSSSKHLTPFGWQDTV